jgi:hypothetical protein
MQDLSVRDTENHVIPNFDRGAKLRKPRLARTGSLIRTYMTRTLMLQIQVGRRKPVWSWREYSRVYEVAASTTRCQARQGIIWRGWRQRHWWLVCKLDQVPERKTDRCAHCCRELQRWWELPGMIPACNLASLPQLNMPDRTDHLLARPSIDIQLTTTFGILSLWCYDRNNW